MLKFKGSWRFEPPENGDFHYKDIPSEAIDDFLNVILKVSTQGSRWGVLEHFKRYFCFAAGTTHARSSSESWAETDLYDSGYHAANNAPLFIEAIYDAFTTLPDSYPDFYTIDAEMINRILVKYDIGYEISPPNLILRKKENLPLVEIIERPSTLEEDAIELYQKSLKRSEELITEGKGREAVQEILWLLESVTTAFRGLETEATIIEGKYFNKITKELKQANRGKSLEQIFDWLTSLHGYLSSPTGGGVRHGLDFKSGRSLDISEARLYCNLIRSYLGFILSEHERLSKKQ